MVISGSIPVKLSIKISFLENFLASKVATKYFKARFNDIQCSGNCFQRKHKKNDAIVELLIYSKSLFNNLNFILIFNGFLNPLRKLSGHGPGVCRKLFPKSRILNKNWTYENPGHDSKGFPNTFSGQVFLPDKV